MCKREVNHIVISGIGAQPLTHWVLRLNSPDLNICSKNVLCCNRPDADREVEIRCIVSIGELYINYAGAQVTELLSALWTSSSSCN